MADSKGKLNPLIERLLYNTFKVLNERDGQMKGSELMSRLGESLEFDGWASERFESTGSPRWKAVLQFRSITAVKAGFLIKKKGVWYLTEEGVAAYKQGSQYVFEACAKGYAKWKAANSKADAPEEAAIEQPISGTEAAVAAKFEEIEADAQAAIEDFINRKNPYEFQDMCAALLRAMGYFTPFVAPKGKDGGVDVIAYRDPLGAASPRFKVQIKHKEVAAPVDEVRKLIGILGNRENIGIIISSGGFTADAKREAMSSHVHVELIDLPRFIGLWQEFYGKMSDVDKQLMPLQPIYFLSPEA